VVGEGRDRDHVARVVASTLAPVENAVSAAFGALHGVLHGGADQAALETADRVGSPDLAPAFVDDCLARGDKVMGMGHREYKVVDPRAVHLKALAGRLAAGTEHEVTFRTLEAIESRFTERMAERGKDLYANVEFYKGLVFRVLGLPPRFFTALFGMSRVFGYLAHFSESRVDNRLVRPQAHYIGPAVERAVEPVA
jgi:citrate synthase